eukprot:1957150-Prorocentrum_lima.AAC.1
MLSGNLDFGTLDERLDCIAEEEPMLASIRIRQRKHSGMLHTINGSIDMIHAAQRKQSRRTKNKLLDISESIDRLREKGRGQYSKLRDRIEFITALIEPPSSGSSQSSFSGKLTPASNSNGVTIDPTLATGYENEPRIFDRDYVIQGMFPTFLRSTGSRETAAQTQSVSSWDKSTQCTSPAVMSEEPLVLTTSCSNGTQRQDAGNSRELGLHEASRALPSFSKVNVDLITDDVDNVNPISGVRQEVDGNL